MEPSRAALPPPAPASTAVSPLGGAVVCGPPFKAFVEHATPMENGIRYTLWVRAREGVRVNDTKYLACHQCIKVTEEGHSGPVAAQRLDLVRVEGIYAKDEGNGSFLYCSRVVLVRPCWEMAHDPAFLAAQPSLARGGIVLLTTQSVNVAPTANRPGLRLSKAAWPHQMVERFYPQLELRWNYEPSRMGERDPRVYVLSAKLGHDDWLNHCKVLMAGSMPPDISVWQALMESGKHRIPLVILCRLDAARSKFKEDFLELEVLGVRADLPSYLEEHCQRVSQEVAAARAAPNVAAVRAEKSAVTNVSVAGMPSDASTREYHYYAMTNNAALRNEASICAALAKEGTGVVAVFFAVTMQEAAAVTTAATATAKEPPTKSSRKK